jgi:hypothetical protein
MSVSAQIESAEIALDLLGVPMPVDILRHRDTLDELNAASRASEPPLPSAADVLDGDPAKVLDEAADAAARHAQRAELAKSLRGPVAGEARRRLRGALPALIEAANVPIGKAAKGVAKAADELPEDLSPAAILAAGPKAAAAWVKAGETVGALNAGSALADIIVGSTGSYALAACAMSVSADKLPSDTAGWIAAIRSGAEPELVDKATAERAMRAEAAAKAAEKAAELSGRDRLAARLIG